MFDVVVVGSINLDLVATAPRLPKPGETVGGTTYAEHAGGKGLNQAVAAARCGASVALIAAVGDDEAGRRLRSVAEADGIDVSAVAVTGDTPTGRALITVDDAAENSIVVIPGANALLRVDALAEARVVIAQLEIPLDQVISAFLSARGRGSRTILNPAPGRELPDELLQLCDVVVPNEHELELVGGADALLARGVTAVVITQGAAGVTVVETADDTTRQWHQPAFAVTPVDTTGAGDAFCGALAARLAAGDDLASAVRFAAAGGALATTTPGAVPSFPDRADIASLMV